MSNNDCSFGFTHKGVTFRVSPVYLLQGALLQIGPMHVYMVQGRDAEPVFEIETTDAEWLLQPLHDGVKVVWPIVEETPVDSLLEACIKAVSTMDFLADDEYN